MIITNKKLKQLEEMANNQMPIGTVELPAENLLLLVQEAQACRALKRMITQYATLVGWGGNHDG